MVGTLAATDPEGDPLSYSIAAGTDPDGDGTAAFRIEGDQLLVNDSGDLDYETGELWGNFPQTYSLVGVINCAGLLSKPWSEVR